MQLSDDVKAAMQRWVAGNYSGEKDEWYTFTQLMNDERTLADAFPAVIAENERLKVTNIMLNRRCQHAESAARETVERVRNAGPSIGRSLAGWAAEDCRRKLESMTADYGRLAKNLEECHAYLEGIVGTDGAADLLRRQRA